MSSLVISDLLDVSDKLVRTGRSQAAINNVQGILAQVTTYLLKDNNGEVSPFASKGFLNRNFWRDQTIKQTNDDGATIFTGAIQKVGWRRDQFGFQTTIEARNPIGVFLDFRVEENEIFAQSGSTGLSEFTVNGAQAVGDTTIELTYTGASGSDVEVPVPSLVAFTDSLVPRYQVTSQTSSGSPLRTTSITLDRALETPLTNGQQVSVSTPTVRSGPAAIRRALISAGLGEFIGSSFAQLDATDTAAGYTLWMHILNTDNITLASHISKLLELTDLYLTFSEQDGKIDVIRGLQWGGLTITDNLTDDEIIGPQEITYDTSKLIEGYQLFYVSGAELGEAVGLVDQAIIDQYANRGFWQPLRPNSQFVMDNKYLYNSSTSADFFGERRINYYGVPRIKLKARLKPSVTGNPLNLLNLQLAKEFALSTQVSPNNWFIDEPCRVMAYNYDDNNQLYPSITLELTNFPSPNVPRNVQFPVPPVVLTFLAINQGFSATFEPLTGDLFVEIYFNDKQFLVLSTELNAVTVGTTTTATLQSALLNNGQTYQVRFFVKNGGVSTDKTDFFELVPEDLATAQFDVDNFDASEFG